MKREKQKKLATRVIAFIVIGLIVAFGILTSIIAVSTSKVMVGLQEEYIALIAEENARISKVLMETMINKQSVLASTIVNLDAISPEQRLAYLKGLMEKTRAEEQEILSLYYVVGSTEYSPSGFSAYITSGAMKFESSKNAILSDEAYAAAQSQRNLTIIDPHNKSIDGKEYLVLSILQPVFDTANQFVGLVGCDIDTSLLVNTQYNTGGYKSFTNVIVSGNQMVIMNTNDPSAIGKKFAEITLSKYPERILEVAKGNQVKTIQDEFRDGSKQYRGCVPFFVGNSSSSWLSLTSVSNGEFMEPVVSEVAMVVLICLLTLVVISVFSLLIINRSLRPVRQLETIAEAIADGDLSVNFPQPSNDEIGALSLSFMKVRDTILLLVDKIHLMENEYTAGEIDIQITETEFKGQFAEVARSVNKILHSFVTDMLVIIEGYGKIGDGDFMATIKEFPGKKQLVNAKFNELRTNISSLNSEIRKLIEGAIQGQLNLQVDTNAYKGDWQKLTLGLNHLLEAIRTPIAEANSILDRLSEGDFSVEVSRNYKGSFASMMNSFDKMIENTSSYITEITEVLEIVAKGDLSKSITREYIGQFNFIKTSINSITERLNHSLTEIQNSAANVLSGARQISETSMHLANGASNQASAVEELNASITEISQQSQDNAEKTKAANELSQKSIQGAKEGNEEMHNMLKSMEEIKEASRNISNIIRVIDDIAFQTNILALNAAVEAARAGAHGKGFAVVAEEVRALAARSAEAAKETSELIENAITKISEGTTVASQTAVSLENIVSNINSISEIILSIDEATASQKENIAQISIGINQISEVVQSNSSTSEESAAAAQELNSQSEILSEVVGKFRLKE